MADFAGRKDWTAAIAGGKEWTAEMGPPTHGVTGNLEVGALQAGNSAGKAGGLL